MSDNNLPPPNLPVSDQLSIEISDPPFTSLEMTDTAAEEPLPLLSNPPSSDGYPRFSSSDSQPVGQSLSDASSDTSSSRTDSQPVGQSSSDASSLRTDLSEDEFTALKMRVSYWCTNKMVNLNKLKVVMSGFTGEKLTLARIQDTDNAQDLIELLSDAGLIKQTDISVLIEIIKLCGIEGVESEIDKTWKVPKFEDVPIKHVKDHRQKLLAFGRRLNSENIKRIGQLSGIRVDKNTDPYSLILKLEKKGLLEAGENLNKFIEKIKKFDMPNEANALKYGK